MPVDYPSVHLHLDALFSLFTLQLGEFIWFDGRSGCVFFGLPVSFSRVKVYFKKPSDDSKFHCADLCCHSNPQFYP